ncbi:terminase small subunit [Ferrimonas balearica]|uniref:terminase small subunit n=1 Tax=Ferrimonas balearica TaxID=44012 RepID=UPI001F2DAA28|nr:terminase small subunit [Ferrimonas balearica]MBY6093842.1 terminase small subunit [Ferrimonas balearica]
MLRYCEIYLASVHRDPTACVKEVWPNLTEQSARSKAGQLMRPSHKVGAYLHYMMYEMHRQVLPALAVTEGTVISEIARLAFANVKMLYDENGDMLPIQDLPDDIAAAVQEVTERVVSERGGESVIERKYKLADKSKNLEVLGRYMQLFVDKSETNISVVNSEIERVINAGNEDDSPIPK